MKSFISLVAVACVYAVHAQSDTSALDANGAPSLAEAPSEKPSSVHIAPTLMYEKETSQQLSQIPEKVTGSPTEAEDPLNQSESVILLTTQLGDSVPNVADAHERKLVVPKNEISLEGENVYNSLDDKLEESDSESVIDDEIRESDGVFQEYEQDGTATESAVSLPDLKTAVSGANPTIENSPEKVEVQPRLSPIERANFSEVPVAAITPTDDVSSDGSLKAALVQPLNAQQPTDSQSHLSQQIPAAVATAQEPIGFLQTVKEVAEPVSGVSAVTTATTAATTTSDARSSVNGYLGIFSMTVLAFFTAERNLGN